MVVTRGDESATIEFPDPTHPERQAPEPKSKKSWTEFGKFCGIVGIVVLLMLAARWASQPALFSILAGALGGLLHELVQSGGLITLPGQVKGDYYLGSVGGLATGALAGMGALAVPGAAPDYSATTGVVGFALKGTAESGMVLQKVRAGAKQSLDFQ